MAGTAIATIANTKVTLRWMEPYVSAGLNRQSKSSPRGILRGFEPSPGVVDLSLRLLVDSVHNDSVMNLVGQDATVGVAGQYALTYVEDGEVVLEGLPASSVIYVAAVHQYQIGVPTVVEWRYYTQAEHDAGDSREGVVVCRIETPAAGPLDASMISVMEADLSYKGWSSRGMRSDVPVLISSPDSDPRLYDVYNTTPVQVTRDSTSKKFGTHSIRMESLVASPMGSGVYRPLDVFRVVPGEPLHIRMWLKSTVDVADVSSANIYLNYGSAGVFGIDISADVTNTGGSYKLLQKQAIVPASAEQATMRVEIIFQNGVVNLDSMSVSVLREPTTDTDWIDPVERNIGRPIETSRLLVNSGTNPEDQPWVLDNDYLARDLVLSRVGGGRLLAGQLGSLDVILGEGSQLAIGYAEDPSNGINTFAESYMLCLKDSDGVSTLWHRDDSDIALDELYGEILAKGGDLQGAGVRGKIQALADGSSGAMRWEFSAAGDSAALPTSVLEIRAGEVRSLKDLNVDADVGVSGSIESTVAVRATVLEAYFGVAAPAVVTDSINIQTPGGDLTILPEVIFNNDITVGASVGMVNAGNTFSAVAYIQWDGGASDYSILSGYGVVSVSKVNVNDVEVVFEDDVAAVLSDRAVGYSRISATVWRFFAGGADVQIFAVRLG